MVEKKSCAGVCGSPGKGVYPPGYSSSIKENRYDRRGCPNETLEMYHDWYELASAMAPYRVSPATQSNKILGMIFVPIS